VLDTPSLPLSRKPVGAAALQVGSAEGGDHHLLHPADPGGAAVPPREPDRPPRHQGTASGHGEVLRGRQRGHPRVLSHYTIVWN